MADRRFDPRREPLTRPRARASTVRRYQVDCPRDAAASCCGERPARCLPRGKTASTPATSACTLRVRSALDADEGVHAAGTRLGPDAGRAPFLGGSDAPMDLW